MPADPPKKSAAKTVKPETQKTRQTTRSSSAVKTQVQKKKPEVNKKRNLKQFEESCANDPKVDKKGKGGKSAAKPPPVKKLKVEEKKRKPAKKIEDTESSEESSEDPDDSESAFSEGQAKAEESSSSADGSAFDESSDLEADEPPRSESSDMVMIDSSTRKKGPNRRRPSTAATTNIVAKENFDFNDDDEDLGGNGTNTSDRKAAW